MQPNLTEHTPSEIPTLRVTSEEDEDEEDREREAELVPVQVIGEVIAFTPVQHEGAAEDDADVRPHETAFPKTQHRGRTQVILGWAKNSRPPRHLYLHPSMNM